VPCYLHSSGLPHYTPGAKPPSNPFSRTKSLAKPQAPTTCIPLCLNKASRQSQSVGPNLARGPWRPEEGAFHVMSSARKGL